MNIIKVITMPIKKKKLSKSKRQSSAREGLVSTKLTKESMEAVECWSISSGLHTAYVLRGLIALGLFYLENEAPNDPFLVISKAGSLAEDHKKAA